MPGYAFHPTRSAADSAPRRMQPVSRNPFRARRALQKTDPDPARLRESPSADRDIPPSARDTCGAWSGVSPYRPPPPTGHSAPPQTGGSIPFRPHIPPRTDRRFRSMQAAQFRPAQTGCSTRCRQAMLRTAGHSLRRGRRKKTGTAAHSLRRGRHKKNGTAAHTRPRKGNRIS